MKIGVKLRVGIWVACGIGLVAGGPVAMALTAGGSDRVAVAPVATGGVVTGDGSVHGGGAGGDKRGGPPEGRGKPTEPPGQAKKGPKEPPPPLPTPIVAVIDTGARATHQEFNYEGPTSTTDQFVGWWDFTDEVKTGQPDPATAPTPTFDLPEPGQKWDDMVADPYDTNGHGTYTASMAVGLNVNPDKDPSAAPGFPVAIAKVGKGNGSINGDIAAAVRWAAFTVGADVINISIGSIVPFPTFLSAAEYDAFEEVRRAGKLVVVANGNGLANRGIPGDPGWASNYSSATDVLSVGAETGAEQRHTDPEVVAKYSQLLMADNDSDTGYARANGTSFSSPFVAGLGARLLDEARRSGHDVGADYIETLLKYSATDRSNVPPNLEGYGVLNPATVALAAPFASTATLPTRPDPDVSGLYVESGSGTLRRVWSDELRQLPSAVVPIGAGGNGPGVIGPSAPTGVSDAEFATIDAKAGETVTVTLDFVSKVYGEVPDVADVRDDIDLYVFEGTGGPFTADRLVAKSTKHGAEELATFKAPGPVTVVALGWLVTSNVAIQLGASLPLAPAGDGYAVHNRGVA